MKYLLAIVLLLSMSQLKAQQGDFEIKVRSTVHGVVIGQLRKTSVEGIGVEDYDSKYFVFRPNEIVKIRIRKRGLTFFEALGKGSLIGLGIGGGAVILLSDEGNNTVGQWQFAAIALGAGIVGGATAGAIAQIVNTKLTLHINQNGERYKSVFKQLDPYINKTVTEHF